MSYPKRPRLASPDPDDPTTPVPAVQAMATPKLPSAVAGAPRLDPTASRPELWDRPARNVFSPFDYGQVALARNRETNATELLGTEKNAIERLDQLLSEKMKTVLPETAARDPFWAQFSSLRKGVAADMLAEVMELLSGRTAEVARLEPRQVDFVANHPLTKWLNWIRPSSGSIIGK